MVILSKVNELLDGADKAILNELQINGRISNVELAERVHLSPPATHARVKRLEKSGYISGYSAQLNREKLGLDNLVFIEISLQLHQYEHIQSVLDKIISFPEVLECFHVTGDFDYLLKISIENTKALHRFITEKLTPLKGVARIHTSLVLKEVKSSSVIQLE